MARFISRRLLLSLLTLWLLATIVFGIYPDPLFQVARDAGSALSSLV